MPRDEPLPAQAETLAAGAWRLAFDSLSVEDGLVLREAAEPRFFPAPDPDRYRGLLSVKDLERFLATDAGRAPRVSMADAGQDGSAGVPETRFLREDGRVDPARLHAAFDAGCTLVVSQFHEMHAPLARFCRGLEKVFLHAVQANIYLTPPGAQGFHAHYDTHDVLILQVQGVKQWRVWPSQPVPHPSRRLSWKRQTTTPDVPPLLPLMQPGDALYIPRGVMHDASAQGAGEPSLHLTIGLLEPCWAEALRIALEQAELEDPTLRLAFPTWRIGEPGALEAMAAFAAARLAEVTALPAMERLSVGMLDRLARDQIAHSARSLPLREPGPDSMLRLSDMAHTHVAANPDGSIVLRWAGDPIPLAPEALAWLEQLTDGATPAQLGGEDALAFCRTLHTLGLLDTA